MTLFLLFCAAWMRKLMFRCWEVVVPRNWFTVSTGHEDHMWWFQPEAHHHLQLEAVDDFSSTWLPSSQLCCDTSSPSWTWLVVYFTKDSAIIKTQLKHWAVSVYMWKIFFQQRCRLMQKHWWGESVSTSLELLSEFFFLPGLNVSAASLHWAAVELCGYRL